MQRNIKLLLSISILFAMGGLCSCDNVPEDERFVEVPSVDPPGNDPGENPGENPGEDPGDEMPKRRVLVQEFTGQGCINCPQGAAIVHSLQSQRPGRIVAVNMHASDSPFCRPLGGLKLTSDEANVYYNYFKPGALPAALIDGAVPLTNTALWTDAILNALSLPTVAKLELETAYDASTRELKVTYTSKFYNALATPLNINIWVMENGIVGPQYSGQNIVRDYVHNHVLRTTLTGEWGIKLADSFIKTDEFTYTYTVTLDESWVAENCEVIAFLQNPSSKAVEQSAEAPVIGEE